MQIAGSHTNVICVKKDNEILFEKEYKEAGQSDQTDRNVLTVGRIVAFADEVEIKDIKDVLDRQISYKMPIAEEGLRGEWGASVGKGLLNAYGNDVATLAKATAAAGSDARMSGCEMPVVINSGS